MRGRVSSKSLSAPRVAERFDLQRTPRIDGERGRFELRVGRLQRVLLAAGLLGLVAVLLISIPGNRVFDVNLRPHHLIGMLFAHACALALLIGCSPWRWTLLSRAERLKPKAFLGWSLAACGAFVAGWLAAFAISPAYMSSLVRESGPLEPLQAALYTVASWLAWQCARRAARPDERRLFRVATLICAWLALEEVEYFGVFELVAGGRIHGVWVRAVHDLIALGVKVPAVRTIVIALAVLVAAGGLLYIGPRCVLRQATSPASVPAVLALVVLALSQVLDQDNRAMAGYGRLLTYRLEEPLELVTSFLLNVALVIKYGEKDGRGERI